MAEWLQFDMWLARHGLSVALWPTPAEQAAHLDYQQLQPSPPPPPRRGSMHRAPHDREAEAELLRRLLEG